MNMATSRNKKKFRTLCSKEISIPIFIQAWWLDAVCGNDNCDVVIAEKGGVIPAAIPYYMPKRGFIRMTPLTQHMGVWYRHIGGKAVTQLSR